MFHDRTLQKLPTGDYKQRFLTEREVIALLDEAQKDKHPFVYLFAKLLILTGARKGEARTARWRDMDRANRIWTVPVSKSGRSRRIVLSDSADALLDVLAERNMNLDIPVGPNDFLFTNPRTGTCYDSFYAAWHRIRDEAGLPEVRIHDLRHSFASFLINKGASIYEVQQLLGHHHISMTQRYAHLLPNTLRNRVEIVSSALNKASATLFD
ncbi:site-specific integrase [Anianabacter salinae]|uniref:site-specific integrase n=1 Tax=Anianabacter salinae TaxID=2851023 RepID=UPI00225DF6EE|nr:site-specific integrase [Anianabacter salinae]